MNQAQKKYQIGIIGPEEINLPKNKQERIKMLDVARKVGETAAKNNVVLITGGCTGVVEAACRAAYEAGGIIVGTPGRERGSSNPWVNVEICTPIDVGDFLFAGILSCDAIIVLPGDAGTLAELAIAYRYRKPLIFIKGFGEDILSNLKLKGAKNFPCYVVKTAEEAVKKTLQLLDN
jgi:uncharacterized protein (TIGR00725 family)